MTKHIGGGGRGGHHAGAGSMALGARDKQTPRPQPFNVFTSADVPPRIAQARRSMRLNSPHVRLLFEALDISAVRYHPQGWIPECQSLAHATLPDHRVAIRIISANSAKFVQQYEGEWAAAGWTLKCVWPRNLRGLSSVTLASMLLDYLKTLPKK